MNKLLSALLASVALFTLTTPTAHAAAGTANFNVTATLASACTVGAIADLNFGTVTAFVAPTNPTTTALISCTRTLTGVTAQYDAAGGGAGLATLPTSDGLLSNGLRYTLTTTKGAVSSGAAATTTLIGGADTFTYTITGHMEAQAGTCSSGSCAATPQVRTLTLNF